MFSQAERKKARRLTRTRRHSGSLAEAVFKLQMLSQPLRPTGAGGNRDTAKNPAGHREKACSCTRYNDACASPGSARCRRCDPASPPAARSSSRRCARSRHHAVDVFVDEPIAAAHGPRSHSAHDFLWRHRETPYDLTVYQLGNSSHHDYLWPYLFRYPGLTVLHDAHLHHARAAALLRTRRRATIARSSPPTIPTSSPDAAELAVAGFDTHLYYIWPMARLVVEASTLSAVHSRDMADALAKRSAATLESMPSDSARARWSRTNANGAARRDVRAQLRHPARRGRVRLLRRADAGEAAAADPRRVCAPFVPTFRTARLLLAGRSADTLRPRGRHRAIASSRTRSMVTGYLETDES